MQMITANDFKPDELLEYTGENIWNAIYTVQLGELAEKGVFDWTREELNWSSAAYDADQYARVCAYFVERYRYREISIEPFLEWALMLKRKLVYELMPKYKPLYERVSEGVDPLQVGGEYFKRRIIGSEYPETLLSANSDYASTGEDLEHEKLTEGDFSETLQKFVAAFRGVDELLLDELETMFIGLYTMNTNVL